jgi:molybdenum ABC transporter molybdate-binding protein
VRGRYEDALRERAHRHLHDEERAEPPAKLEALADAKYTKVAIANPEHAPYGQAAREALRKTGAWDAVSKKVVYGENVQQTMQFAQSGNVDAAIVALSLAIVTEGTYVPIDPSLHAPIDQALVGSPEGREVMKRYGFLSCPASRQRTRPESRASTRASKTEEASEVPGQTSSESIHR